MRFLEIALSPLITYALFATARAVSIRLRRRLPANRFTEFLYRPHRVRPLTDADRRDWHPVIWPLLIFALLVIALCLTDPARR
jgi:hypothetical protein